MCLFSIKDQPAANLLTAIPNAGLEAIDLFMVTFFKLI